MDGGGGGVGVHCFFFIAATGVGVGGEGHVAFFVRFLLLNQNQGIHMYSFFIFWDVPYIRFHGRKIANIIEESKMAKGRGMIMKESSKKHYLWLSLG
jgi:hypothetical protein